MDKPKKNKPDTDFSSTKNYISEKVKRPNDSFEGAFNWGKKTVAIEDCHGKKSLVTAEVYDASKNNLVLSTGPVGKYLNSEYLNNFLSKVKSYTPGRYNKTKDVFFEDEG